MFHRVNFYVGAAMNNSWLFYEFFAGGGMARAGLGEAWECLFANDISHMKGAAYAANYGDNHLVVAILL